MSKFIEEWRPIEGYEGLYEVSDWGNVKSVDRIVETSNSVREYKGKIIQNCLSDTGYYDVKLYKKGLGKHRKVHILVAKAFVENPDSKPCVDHKNGNRQDNRAENLRWCTQKENNNFEVYRGKQKNNAKKSKQVCQYSLNGVLTQIWPSSMEAERNGFNSGHIIKCCKGKQKTHKGYMWSYLPL